METTLSPLLRHIYVVPLTSSSFVQSVCHTSTWGQHQIQIYAIERVYDEKYMLE